MIDRCLLMHSTIHVMLYVYMYICNTRNKWTYVLFDIDSIPIFLRYCHASSNHICSNRLRPTFSYASFKRFFYKKDEINEVRVVKKQKNYRWRVGSGKRSQKTKTIVYSTTLLVNIKYLRGIERHYYFFSKWNRK